ncbi:hypothetical protein [Terrabacter sp. Ter38]|uniref:hypothetical protein n=1 Tax=Terrabacter sp. Ter38 TaxID=2926030 RepID=UPI002118C09F|nr:hypothetical protein [Terrabacter sp. Ter38]
MRKHWSARTAASFAPGSSTGYAGRVRSQAPATLPGSVAVGAGVVGAGVVGVGVALGVADGRGVGFVGVSGAALTVGIGSVEPGWTVPVAVAAAVAVGDSTADVVCGVVPLQAASVRPSTTIVAAEANPRDRS